MPKGVEHWNMAEPLVADFAVSSSVMPKGVEHRVQRPPWDERSECRVQ